MLELVEPEKRNFGENFALVWYTLESCTPKANNVRRKSIGTCEWKEHDVIFRSKTRRLREGYGHSVERRRKQICDH